MYLYGTDFEIRTDHKPLELIYSLTRKSHPSARFSWWILWLQPYSVLFYSETHPRERKHCRYFISPHRSAHQIVCETVHRTKEYVRFVAENVTPCSLVYQELSYVRECIQKRQWEILEIKCYLMVKSELSVSWKTSTTRNSDPSKSLLACEKEYWILLMRAIQGFSVNETLTLYKSLVAKLWQGCWKIL